MYARTHWCSMTGSEDTHQVSNMKSLLQHQAEFGIDLFSVVEIREWFCSYHPAADYGSYGYGQPQQAAGYAGYGYDPNQFVAGGQLVLQHAEEK